MKVVHAEDDFENFQYYHAKNGVSLNQFHEQPNHFAGLGLNGSHPPFAFTGEIKANWDKNKLTQEWIIKIQFLALHMITYPAKENAFVPTTPRPSTTNTLPAFSSSIDLWIPVVTKRRSSL